MDYNKMDQTSEKKRSLSTILVLVLLVILLALLILIAVTYALKLPCDDNDDNGTHKKSRSSSTSFLLFSDIHLDLFYKEDAPAGKMSFCRNESMPSTYNAPYGRIGCDSPLGLLNQLLNAMKEQESNVSVDFVMLSGDTCAHQLTTNRRQEALKIMNTASKAVQSTFPDTPYFPNIGNNDLPGHYVMPDENDTWYSDLLNIWEDAILCKHCKDHYQTTTAEELRQTFLYGGYYKVSIAGGKMSLLVLNSMYWTFSTWKPDDYFQERAVNQMMWLEEQLKLANSMNKKVIITSHIAPGIDAWSGLELWLSNFTDLYMDLVTNKFSEVIAGQIYAHFHKDSFRFLQANKKDLSFKNSSFILLMPSVSVVYKNNPNFRVVHFDPELQAIRDYEQWYMNLVMATEFKNPVWQLDYKFSSRYPPSGNDDQVINGKRIKNLSDNLINQTDDSFFNGYINSRQVRYQPDPFSRFRLYCAVSHYDQADFDLCQKKYFVPGG